MYDFFCSLLVLSVISYTERINHRTIMAKELGNLREQKGQLSAPWSVFLVHRILLDDKMQNVTIFLRRNGEVQ